mgnify:CR=1 FL=1
MPKSKKEAIPDQSEHSKKGKSDLKIYPPRKFQDFVKIDRDLHPFYQTMFDKNGAVLFIAAPPSSGKTSYISNLLGREIYFKDLFDSGIYVCSPTIHNDIGAGVIRAMADHMETEFTEEYAHAVFNLLSGGDDEDEEGNGLSCLLFDDCMGSFKQNTFVGRICSMCRHLKTLVIFSNQRVVGVPANIRANISHTVTYNQPSSKEFQKLVELHSCFGGEQTFIDAYNDACNVRYGALLADFRAMKLYKQVPDTGEIIELYSRYNDDGSLKDNRKMTKDGLKQNMPTEKNDC